jgi:hypothetical protein
MVRKAHCAIWSMANSPLFYHPAIIRDSDSSMARITLNRDIVNNMWSWNLAICAIRIGSYSLEECMQLSESLECSEMWHHLRKPWKNLCQSQPVSNFNQQHGLVLLCESVAVQFDIWHATILFSIWRATEMEAHFWISFFLTIGTISGRAFREQALSISYLWTSLSEDCWSIKILKPEMIGSAQFNLSKIKRDVRPEKQ